MAYLRSHGTPKAINPFGDVTLTGSQTLTNKTFTTPTVGSMTNYTFPAGHVLQVLHASESGSMQSSSTSYITTGLEQAITPTATSSKIIIHVSNTHDTSQSNNALQYALYRSGSQIVAPTAYGHGAYRVISTFAQSYLDSPSTTSAVTYQLFCKSTTGTSYFRYSDMISQMTVMEVSG